MRKTAYVKPFLKNLPVTEFLSMVLHGASAPDFPALMLLLLIDRAPRHLYFFQSIPALKTLPEKFRVLSGTGLASALPGCMRVVFLKPTPDMLEQP